MYCSFLVLPVKIICTRELKKRERQRDALQFRQFIWGATREMEHDKELRTKGGRKRRGVYPKASE